MAHLKEKLAELFYGELPASEMDGARRHLAECTECQIEFGQYEKMHLALRSAPDLDPPRQIVFAPPEPRSWFPVFNWRWVTPLMAASALIIAILNAVSPAPTPVSIVTPVSAPAVVQAQNVDYARIVSELRGSDRAWIASELDKRDKEIQRLRGELAYYDNLQRTVLKETWNNASSIQLLAQRSESQD
ncbi:MAG TPA: hypothetical protein VE422_33500 [Terriglobia bacterium]|nr:hypothetical protein [Terriglobia bacterium]